MTRSFFLALPAAALLAIGPASAREELNALVWCDHADPALLEPFEERHDVKINVKEYEGTAAGLAIIDQSRPGDWDVMVIDAVDVGRAVDRDLFAPLTPGELQTADFFPAISMKEHNSRDGVAYAVTEKFGYNTVAFNKKNVDIHEISDLSALWSEKYKNRIAIYDYYLPVLGLVGIEQGISTSEIDAEALAAMQNRVFALKDQALMITDVVGSQTALATGEVDILIGGGEWLTASLNAENPDLDWIVPEQGALRWAQSVAVLNASENKELALEFIKYLISPEGQMRLATSSCYWGMPANAKAGDMLNTEQKALLRWSQQAEMLSRSQLYPAPDAETDAAMQDLWTEMLQR